MERLTGAWHRLIDALLSGAPRKEARIMTNVRTCAPLLAFAIGLVPTLVFGAPTKLAKDAAARERTRGETVEVAESALPACQNLAPDYDADADAAAMPMGAAGDPVDGESLVADAGQLTMTPEEEAAYEAAVAAWEHNDESGPDVSRCEDAHEDEADSE